MLVIKHLAWHYSKGIKKFLQIFRNFLKFFWHFFSTGVLLKTLFFPWKKDIAFSNWRGFHPILLVRKIINNIFTRLIGLVIRSIVIIIGLIAELAVIILGAAGFIFWIILPLIFVFSLVAFIGLFTADNLDYLYKIIVGDLLFFSIWLSLISVYGFMESRKKSIGSRSLPELAKEKWFIRVWNRLGFKKENKDIKQCFSDPALLEKILLDIGISPEAFSEIIDWEKEKQKIAEENYKFWKLDKLMTISPVGKTWAYAYTVEIDKYSRDLPAHYTLPYKNSYLMGHKKDIDLAELVLSRPYQNSLFLIGEPGIGKRTLINLIAKKIFEEKTNSVLKNKRLVELDLGKIVADYDDQALARRLHKIFQEAAFSGNVILVIYNIHEFLSSGDEKTSTSFSSILGQYLALPTFQIVGTISPSAFHAYLERNGIIMKYADKIILEEPSKKEVRLALLNVLEKEEKEKIIFSYQAISEIIELADQYITDSPMPEKAIDVSEEVFLDWARKPHGNFISKDDVDEFFSRKFSVPIGKIGEAEKTELINLENNLHKRVVGQEEAIRQISESMRRARSGISDSSKPIGSFLFLGPTGVGKTESAKALAEAYFGSEEKMIRLDMSEYQALDSIGRLIGSESLNSPGQLISSVNENPFAVLLLDEIEKAHPDILNLFLQVLDEGWLTDVFGKKAIFKNMIIIATSNAGADLIKEEISKKTPPAKIQSKLIDYVIKKGIFKPEFLNRFEKIIFFGSLEQEELRKVAGLLIKKIGDRVRNKKNITVGFDDAVIDKVIQNGYDPIFGARSLRRFIQDKVEDVIAKKIVSGELSQGDKINLSEEDIKL